MAVVRVVDMSEVQLAYAVLMADAQTEKFSAAEVWRLMESPSRDGRTNRYNPLGDAHQFRMVLYKVLKRGATIAKSQDWGFLCRDWTANVEFRCATVELAVCRCYVHSVFGYTVDMSVEVD